jgi:hypothetical protein
LEHLAQADGIAAAGRRCFAGQGHELPDAIGVSLAPWSVGNELQVEQSREGLIDVLSRHAKFVGHALSSVEGRAVSIGSQAQEDQHGCALGSEACEPTVAQ